MGRATSRPTSNRHIGPPSPIALRTAHELDRHRRQRTWRWDRAAYALHVSWPRFVVQEVLAMNAVVVMMQATTGGFPRWCLWLFVAHVTYYASVLVWRCGRAPASPRPAQWLEGEPRSRHGRIELRHPDPADRRELSRSVDRVVSRTMGFRRRDTRAYKIIPRYRFAVREQGYFAIYRLDDGRAAGVITFHDITDGNRTASIGMWLGPSHRGQRLATDALAAATQLGWSLGLTTVRAGTASDNRAMVHVLESIGATLVDTRPHRLPDRRLVSSRWYEQRNPGFTIGR